MESQTAALGRVAALARHLQETQQDGREQTSEQTSARSESLAGVAMSPCSSAVRRTLPRFDSNVLANYIDDLRSMKNEVYEVRLARAPRMHLLALCRAVPSHFDVLGTYVLACSSSGSTRSYCPPRARA